MSAMTKANQVEPDRATIAVYRLQLQSTVYRRVFESFYRLFGSAASEQEVEREGERERRLWKCQNV